VNDPIWKLWTVAKPTCEDAACASPRPGKWTTNGRVLSVVNRHGPRAPFGGTGTAFTLPATSGKFFLKTLLPADARLQILGDDGTFSRMYQTGNDDGTTLPWISQTCSQSFFDLYGWGRIEVRPGTVKNVNAFLNVIQFGNADTLRTMANTDTVESEDGVFVVTRIQDSQRDRIVVFAKDRSAGAADTAFRYSFTPASAASDHVVADLSPSSAYYVVASGSSPTTIEISRASTRGTLVQSDGAGVLAYQLEAGRVTGRLPLQPPQGVQMR